MNNILLIQNIMKMSNMIPMINICKHLILKAIPLQFILTLIPNMNMGIPNLIDSNLFCTNIVHASTYVDKSFLALQISAIKWYAKLAK